MPVSYQIDPGHRVVEIAVVGEFESADIVETLRNIAGDPQFEVGFDFLSDNRLVARPITTEQVKVMTSFVSHGPAMFAGVRAALVTSNATSFGMMRMFASLAEEMSLRARAFDNLESARAWLAESRPRPHGVQDP